MAPIFTGRAFGFGRSAAAGGGGVSASGGTILESGGYTYHVFTTDDNFINDTTRNIEMLLVGGGGGIAGSYTGGGGGGGIAYAPSISFNAGTYAVQVGDGGAYTASLGTDASGQDTTFVTPLGTITAKGGGTGIIDAFVTGPSGTMPGGSGGGNGDDDIPGAGTATQPSQPTFGGVVTNYGNPGFSPPSGNGPGTDSRGGGGGGAGSGGPTTTTNGPGGNGQPFPSFPGPVIAPAVDPLQPGWSTEVGPTGLFGGGGAGNAGPPNSFTGGTGGGGNSGGFPGMNYTGGGGGGVDGSGGGSGGKGIVIIRYSS